MELQLRVAQDHSRRIAGPTAWRWRLVTALVAGLLAGVTTVAAPAAAASKLPSRAQQIRVLKAAEKRIAHARGDAAFGDVALQDLKSFDITPLWNRGIDGAGETVAVLEAWNDPKIQRLVNALDPKLGLPHADIRTVYPDGPLPKRCPAGMRALGSGASCRAWQGELVLDVEAVHLLAPYAQIVISATPSGSEPGEDWASLGTPPEIMKALEYLSTRHIANVMSISAGSGETTYRYGKAEVLSQEPGTITAAAAGVPVTVATGDCGAVQEVAHPSPGCQEHTKGPTIAAFADSPFVTALGGVSPHRRHGQNLFSVWNIGHEYASNAGLSKVYPMPGYQDGVASTIGAPWRSVPDITMDGNDGTSEAAPEFAAVLALATQLKGGDLGPINQILYQDLGPAGPADGVVDVTRGNDTTYGIKGYDAKPGFDIATGWGTISAAKFVPALVRAVHREPRGSSLQAQAVTTLNALKHTGKVTPASGSATTTRSVISTGFMPALPVRVLVDGHLLRTVRTEHDGDLHVKLNLTALKLSPGRHTLTLQGMLLTQHVRFMVSA